jgi:hypothetical protein
VRRFGFCAANRSAIYPLSVTDYCSLCEPRCRADMHAEFGVGGSRRRQYAINSP